MSTPEAGAPQHAIPAPLADKLLPREQVVWWGQPRPGAYVMGGMLVTVPLGLVALASAWHWAGGIPSGASPAWVLAVLGLVGLFALHMLLLRPVLSLAQARATYYAVTNRRALALCLWGWRRQVELPHYRGEITAVEGPATSKIYFGHTEGSALDTLLLGRAARPGFYGLGDLGSVLGLLQGLRGEDGEATGDR